jgi:hypothetical protein
MLRELATKRKAERLEFEARVLEAVRKLGEADLATICGALRLALNPKGNNGRVRNTLRKLRIHGVLVRRHTGNDGHLRAFYRIAEKP